MKAGNKARKIRDVVKNMSESRSITRYKITPTIFIALKSCAGCRVPSKSACKWCCIIEPYGERLTAPAEKIGGSYPGRRIAREITGEIKGCLRLADKILPWTWSREVRDNQSNRHTASAMSAQGPSCVVIAFFHRHRRRRSSMHSTSPGDPAKDIEEIDRKNTCTSGTATGLAVSGRDRPRDRPR